MADQSRRSRHAATPLAGRGHELATLRAPLADARMGRGSLALIGGEAGIGKTALTEALLAEASAQDATVLVGRCYDLAETPPYGPWIEALANTRCGEDLSNPLDHAESAATSRPALFAAVRGYLAALAQRQPVALLLEDLHWADPASLDLLRFVARDLADVPLLLLATYRDNEIAGQHPLYQLLPPLVREAHATRLTLRPLGQAAVQTLVAARYRLAAAEEARLVAYLQRRAEGNPLFLGELLHTLEDERLLYQEGNDWALARLDTATVPTLLRQMIDARLAHLATNTREALVTAAVIGQIVPFDLWAALIEREEAALHDLASEVCATRLLEEIADGTGMRFVHALVREAIYDGIRPMRRRALHRCAGAALVAAPDPDPDAVASHLVRAADPRAAEWLRRAGDRAHRAYAWLTAAARYEAALAVRGGIDPHERAWMLYRLAQLRRFADAPGALPLMEEAAGLATAAGDHFLAAHARLGTGHLRCIIGDFRRGMSEMEAGLEAFSTLSTAEQAQQTHLDPTDRSVGVGTLVVYLAALGRYAEACARGERYAAAAPGPETIRQLGAAPHADAQTGLGLLHAVLGRPDAARQRFAQARAALGAVDHAFMVDWVAALERRWIMLQYQPKQRGAGRTSATDETSVGLLTVLGWPDNLPSLWHLPQLIVEGRWREVNETAAVQVSNSLLAPWHATMLAQVAREQGKAQRTWQIVRRWLPAGPATAPGGMDFLEAQQLQRLAAALAIEAGDLPAAHSWLEAQDRWLAWNGAVLGRAEGQLGWAAYHRATGDLDRARACAGQALRLASDPRRPLALLAAHRCLGEIDTAAGRYAEAAAHIDAALTLAQACDTPYERALTLLALAELQLAEARRDAATRVLAEARTIFQELGAAPALDRADTLMQQATDPLAAPTRPVSAPIAATDGLSRREAEVLGLLAAGKSNTQIAALLSLSPSTVQRHVANVYLKIGVHNRAEATAYALRQQRS